jgi:hypothetical protein
MGTQIKHSRCVLTQFMLLKVRQHFALSWLCLTLPKVHEIYVVKSEGGCESYIIKLNYLSGTLSRATSSHFSPPPGPPMFNLLLPLHIYLGLLRERITWMHITNLYIRFIFFLMQTGIHPSLLDFTAQQ